jgi:hypothetical protein
MRWCSYGYGGHIRFEEHLTVDIILRAIQANTVKFLFADMRTDVDLRGLDPRRYLIFMLMLK